MALRQAPFYAALGERIRELRKSLEMTQAQLADSVSLSRTSVTNIETGRQPLYVHSLIRFAEVLRQPVGELLPSLHVKAPPIEVEPQLQRLEPNKRDWVIKVIGNSQETRSDENLPRAKKSKRTAKTRKHHTGAGSR